MLKRIAAADLRVGMYIEEFCGSWMDHPFWRSRFLIANEDVLAKIRASGVDEVMIDAAKGADTACAGHGSNGANGHAPAAGISPDDAAAGALIDEARRTARSADLAQEIERATRILREARGHVSEMFSAARLGGIRDTDGAERMVDNIADSVARHPTAMIGLSRLKRADDYTFLHSVAVSALMVALARTLEFDEAQVRNAGMAGLMHDVGKAQVPLAILNKPGSLDDTEWTTMRQHPERGHAILSGAQGITPEALDAVLHHHEKIDGSGYPHKLAGDDISLLARMTAVCDVYDAVTSNRPYKDGWQPTAAIRKMTEWKGHFDPRLFSAFVKTVGIYPVGSVVRLQSQRLAVVVDHDPSRLLQPTVKVFFSLRSKVHIVPVLLHLDKATADRIVGFEDPAAHGLTRVNELWLPLGHPGT